MVWHAVRPGRDVTHSAGPTLASHVEDSFDRLMPQPAGSFAQNVQAGAYPVVC